MPRYAIVRRKGPGWNASRPMHRQESWNEHAAFMNSLAADGFVVLGGPLGDGDRILLIVDAVDEETVRTMLASDPWTPQLLEIESLEPWQILLQHSP